MTRTLLALLCLAVLAPASLAVADTTDLPPPVETGALAISDTSDDDFKIHDGGRLDLEPVPQGYTDQDLTQDPAAQSAKAVRHGRQVLGLIEANYSGGTDYDHTAIPASTFDCDFKGYVNLEREGTLGDGYWRRE